VSKYITNIKHLQTWNIYNGLTIELASLYIKFIFIRFCTCSTWVTLASPKIRLQGTICRATDFWADTMVNVQHWSTAVNSFWKIFLNASQLQEIQITHWYIYISRFWFSSTFVFIVATCYNWHATKLRHALSHDYQYNLFLFHSGNDTRHEAWFMLP